jgi:hypothetical protein
MSRHGEYSRMFASKLLSQTTSDDGLPHLRKGHTHRSSGVEVTGISVDSPYSENLGSCCLEHRFWGHNQKAINNPVWTWT